MKKTRRPYHYKESTLTLGRLTKLLETKEVIDLNQFSNGATWFKYLHEMLPSRSVQEVGLGGDRI